MSGWLVGNLVWTSVLLALVLAIRLPFARVFGAGPAYALWLLPAFRLVAPPLPAWPVEIAAPHVAEPVVVWVDGASTAAAAAGTGWASLLFVLWAAGALLFLAWQWHAYRLFLTRLSLSARSAGAHHGLPVVESDAVQGPLAIGLLDRRIVVPPDFTQRYSAAEQSLALDHEAIHHRRGDIWWNFAALLFLAANWFNLLAWAAYRAFRADQELACDAVVARDASSGVRGDYAQALVKSASPAGLIAVSPLNHADQLKRRLKMMTSHRRSRLRTLGGSAALSLLAGAAFTAGAPGLAQDEGARDDDGRRERRVIIRTDRGGDRSDAGDRRDRRERVIVMTDRRDGEPRDHRRVRIIGPDGEGHCDNGDATRIEEGSERDRTRIVLCTSGDARGREEALVQARDRLAADDDLGAETRSRITAALDREIARLRESR